MKSVTIAIFLTLGIALQDDAKGAFTLSFDSADFGVSSVYNKVTLFNFQIVVAEPLVAGGVYSNPILHSVDYTIRGVLDDPIPTPSMFPGFLLIRAVTGADFYSLSPDAKLSFAVAASADLSDGLQFDELAGTGTLFEFNARNWISDLAATILQSSRSIATVPVDLPMPTTKAFTPILTRPLAVD